MEKMSGHPRLYRRNATYYHRAAVPVDIKDTYPKSEETFSLKTKDYQVALRLVREAAVRVDRLFDQHRRELVEPVLNELTQDQLSAIQEAYFVHLLEEDDDIRALGFYEEGGDIPEFPLQSFEEYQEDIESWGRSYRYQFARGQSDVIWEDEAKEVLSWKNIGLKLSSRSNSWKPLVRELQKAAIRASDVRAKRQQGEVIETPSSEQTSVETISHPLLSIALEEWIDERTRTSWNEKTAKEHRIWISHFLDVVGDKPIDQYRKSDARGFKSVLLKLPANWSKHRKLKGLKLQKAADVAGQCELNPMSDSNLNKLLGFVAAFWNWAAANYDNVQSDLFKGLKIKRQKRAKDERDPFSIPELQKVFLAPLYTGCKSLHFWRERGTLVPKDAGNFWVPLICLFSGARMGEVIQLYETDICEEDGVQFFDINDEGNDKRLKNSNSKRKIPIHHALIEMGLMDLVEARRVGKEKRLFPDLDIGNDGYYSSPFSKFFNRFLTEVGIKRNKLTFHSFRHTFEDACRECDVSKEVMDALQGHGEEGMSARYGRGHTLRKLNEAMQKIDYPTLDLSHLKKRHEENGRP